MWPSVWASLGAETHRLLKTQHNNIHTHTKCLHSLHATKRFPQICAKVKEMVHSLAHIEVCCAHYVTCGEACWHKYWKMSPSDVKKNIYILLTILLSCSNLEPWTLINKCWVQQGLVLSCPSCYPSKTTKKSSRPHLLIKDLNIKYRTDYLEDEGDSRSGSVRLMNQRHLILKVPSCKQI